MSAAQLGLFDEAASACGPASSVVVQVEEEATCPAEWQASGERTAAGLPVVRRCVLPAGHSEAEAHSDGVESVPVGLSSTGGPTVLVRDFDGVGPIVRLVQGPEADRVARLVGIDLATRRAVEAAMGQSRPLAMRLASVAIRYGNEARQWCGAWEVRQ